MARTVHLTCPQCGHSEMLVVESAENDQPAAEVERSSVDRVLGRGDTGQSDATRLRRLKSLPTSLPVGGIITPV